MRSLLTLTITVTCSDCYGIVVVNMYVDEEKRWLCNVSNSCEIIMKRKIDS